MHRTSPSSLTDFDAADVCVESLPTVRHRLPLRRATHCGRRPNEARCSRLASLSVCGYRPLKGACDYAMNCGNPPSKHHYIPRFLLAQWAVDNGKLWRFLRPIPDKIAVKHVAPAELGYEKDLYATPGLSPDKIQQVEKLFMSQVDDLAAGTHRLILNGKLEVLTQKQRSAWSRFIISQWFRTPAGLGYFKQAMAHALTARDEGLVTRYQEVKERDYPDNLEEVITMMGSDFAGQMAMELFRKMIDDPKNGQRLNNMPCIVIETGESHEFLISDAALQQSRAGIFSAQGFLTLPVAPRKLFIAATEARLVRSIAALPRHELIARHNRAAVRRAAIFVGATDRSQEAFITANFGADPHETMIKGLAERYRADAARWSSRT